MDFNKLRGKARSFILSTTGLIVFVLMFRVFLDILMVNRSNFLISFIYSITDFFISPFKGLINLEISNILINFDAIFSIVFYAVMGIAASEIITSFLYEKFEDIFVNFVDGIFKFIEFFILLRIILNLFRNSTGQVIPGLMSSVMSVTNWTAGILPGIPINGLGYIDLSALLVLFIIVIIDIFTERILYSVFESFKQNNNSKVLLKPKNPKVVIVEKNQKKIEEKPPINQYITINLSPNDHLNDKKLVPVLVPTKDFERENNPKVLTKSRQIKN